jgi:hypothetical protein
MKMDIMKKFENLENVDDLKQALEKVSTEEELMATLKQFGVEMSGDELQALAENVNPKDELGEEDLEMVSGGSAALVFLVIALAYTYYKVKQIKNRR